MPDVSSSPGSGRGRRSNGLPCADWGALVDLDPRLSEALLSSLGSAGVAAYVEPAGGEDVFSRAAQHPIRPLDRLWVDPVRADTARQVVSAEVADLTSLLAEAEPGATAHGFVHAVPRTAAARVLTPPPLPDPPSRRNAAGAVGGPAPTGSPQDAGPPTPAAPPPAPPAAPAARPSPPAPPAAPPPAAPAPSAQSAADAARESDEAFRRIVEGYSRGADGPVPPWPVSEDVDTPRRPPQARRADRPERSLRPERPRPPSRPAPSDRSDRSGQPDRSAPPDRSGQPGRSGQPDRSAQPEQSAQPDPSAQPEQPAPPRPENLARPPRRRRSDEREDADADAEAGALPSWIVPAALEDDGHYVPPPPPPIPRLAPRKLAAAGALLVGFLLMLVPGLLLQARTVGVAIFGLLLTVAGAGALIYLMRDAPRDSDPDDGAVV